MSFEDLFQTLIHKNERLAGVQKLHYLKTNLYGEAEKLLRHITITESNYESAWQFLQERYNNKRILIKTQLKILLSQPIVNVDNAYNIRRLLDTTNECIQALKNLNVDTKGWDIILT